MFRTTFILQRIRAAVATTTKPSLTSLPRRTSQQQLQRQMQQLRQEEEEQKLCFCRGCRRDVAGSNRPRDFFAVLEHGSGHLLDNELGFDEPQEQEQQQPNDEPPEQQHQQQREVLDTFETGVNAQLVARSVVSYLDIAAASQSSSSSSSFSLHLLIVQDPSDHDAIQLKARISRHIRSVIKNTANNSMSYTANSNHDSTDNTLVFLGVFIVGARRARHVQDFLVTPLLNEFAFCDDDELNNDGSNGLRLEHRASLLCPPNSTQSVERTLYSLVEILSVLASKLSRRRLLAHHHNRRRDQLLALTNKNSSKVTVAVLSDHRHVITNLNSLFGRSADFKLVKVK